MKNKSDKNISKEDYLNYLKGRFTSQKAYNLEKSSLADPFDTDALDGMSAIDAGDLDLDLKELSYKLYLKKNRRINFLSIAASISIIITISIWLFWFRELPVEQIAESQPTMKPEEIEPDKETEIKQIQINKPDKAALSVPVPATPEITGIEINQPRIRSNEIDEKAKKTDLEQAILDLEPTNQEEKYNTAVTGQGLSRAAPMSAREHAKIEISKFTWEITKYFVENVTDSNQFIPGQPTKNFEQNIYSTISSLQNQKNGLIEIRTILTSFGEITEIHVLKSYNDPIDSLFINAISVQSNWIPSKVNGVPVNSEMIFKIKIE